MEQQTIVFIPVGKPGSGKETVQKMISSYIKNKYSKNTFFSDTGGLFRISLKQNPNGSLKLNELHHEIVKKRQASGKLQPTAYAIALWTLYFSSFYTGQPFIIVDGSPRKPEELPVLVEFMKEMYGANIHFISIEVSDQVAIQRMQERHKKFPREDTSTIEKIKIRLQQYETLNRPTIERIRETEGSFTIVSNNTTIEELEKIVHKHLENILQ